MQVTSLNGTWVSGIWAAITDRYKLSISPFANGWLLVTGTTERGREVEGTLRVTVESMASELNAPAWLVAALKEGATVAGYMTAGVEDSVHDMIGRITANAEDDQWDRTIWVRYPDCDTAQADSRFMRELRDQVKAEK
jgi:hypothetical protein